MTEHVFWEVDQPLTCPAVFEELGVHPNRLLDSTY